MSPGASTPHCAKWRNGKNGALFVRCPVLGRSEGWGGQQGILGPPGTDGRSPSRKSSGQQSSHCFYLRQLHPQLPLVTISTASHHVGPHGATCGAVPSEHVPGWGTAQRPGTPGGSLTMEAAPCGVPGETGADSAGVLHTSNAPRRCWTTLHLRYANCRRVLFDGLDSAPAVAVHDDMGASAQAAVQVAKSRKGRPSKRTAKRRRGTVLEEDGGPGPRGPGTPGIPVEAEVLPTGPGPPLGTPEGPPEKRPRRQEGAPLRLRQVLGIVGEALSLSLLDGKRGRDRPWGPAHVTRGPGDLPALLPLVQGLRCGEPVACACPSVLLYRQSLRMQKLRWSP